MIARTESAVGRRLAQEIAGTSGGIGKGSAGLGPQSDARARAGGLALAELEFARFALAEIDAVAPLAGEDDALRDRRDYLANVGRIAEALGNAYEALSLAEGSAVEAIGAASAALGPVARYDAALEAIAASLGALQSDASDIANALARERERADFDPLELEVATERLDRLERLKKKYGATLADVLVAREGFSERVERDATRDERDARALAERDGARTELARAAVALSAIRERAARALETRIAGELATLAMPNARFAVRLEALAEIGRNGAERAEFALAANAGDPPRPLARAASGGELSRVLLALVVVLADRRERTALVFDEIDAGIGGATAAAVGERLGSLARRSQVVCVTHLAQLASWADRHVLLRKRERRDATRIDVVRLDGAREILEEIARMLSGTTAAVALEHAQALVAGARTAKAAPTPRA